MADDEMIDMDWGPPPPGTTPVVRAATGRGRTARRSVVMARATIPSALVMLLLLPALGVGWFLLPGDAPLKLGGPALAMGLIVLGLGFGVGAALLMRHVSHEMACQHSGDRR
jgi:hypothetical protein